MSPVKKTLPELYFADARAWRRWLEQNHASCTDGIWLVYYRKETAKPALDYEVSVEEALCFGWIDSLIRKLDATRYCRKFTPRKAGSQWSATNRKRIAKITREGRMHAAGRAQVAAGKQRGTWRGTPRPKLQPGMPEDLSAAIAKNPAARRFFEGLAPTYRKQFIGWVITAKRLDTRARRVRETVDLLARGEKLGLR